MAVSFDELPDFLEESMMNAEEAMLHDFAAIRTGKASPALLDGVMVDYYGTPTRLKELAGVNAPEPRLLTIQPWDRSSIGAIEKAIMNSNLGITPVSDGKVLRLPIPELSSERRQSLAKQAKARAEDAKVAIRNIRRDGNELAKKAQKDGEITEDELKKSLEDIQKMTDNYIASIDKHLSDKDKDLMTV